MTMAAGKVVFALILASVLVADADHNEHGRAMFGYGGPTGPNKWASLSPDYELCSKGKHQSPINIYKNEVAYNPDLETLDRDYVPANATLVNNGFHVALLFDKNVGAVLIGRKNYSLKSVHWHSPSEHTIDGQRPTAVRLACWRRPSIKNLFMGESQSLNLDGRTLRFPVEQHMVHRSDDGKTAVVAILYQYGGHDPFLVQIQTQLKKLAKEACKEDEEAHIPVGVVQTRTLKRHTNKYYRYIGSFTTPPCTENVTWSILGKVREMTKDQVAALQAPLHQEYRNNSRPTQPWNGRVVQLYSESKNHDEKSL